MRESAMVRTWPRLKRPSGRSFRNELWNQSSREKRSVRRKMSGNRRLKRYTHEAPPKRRRNQMPVKTEASTAPTLARAKRQRVPPRAAPDGETVLATADIAMTPEPVFRALNTDEVESWWRSEDTYHMTNWA